MCACVCVCVSVCVHQSQHGDWINSTGCRAYGIACKDQCECEFRTATDAVTPYPLCTPIHRVFAHLPSFFHMLCTENRVRHLSDRVLGVCSVCVEHTNSLHTLMQVAVIAASCCVGPGHWWWWWWL